MFLKPFKIKSNSQLKGSERKSLRAKVSSCFPEISEDDLNKILPIKEVLTSMKILTHSGDLAVIYNVLKKPVFFEHEQRLFPTIFTLWTCPNLIRTFTTNSFVLSKLVNGADLMMPGIFLEGSGKIGTHEKGDLAAVNLTENKAPVAVGVTSLSAIDMFMSNGKGRAVHIIHIIGDTLCTMDPSVKIEIPQLGPPDFLKISENKADEHIETDVVNNQLADEVDKSNIADTVLQDDRNTTSIELLQNKESDTNPNELESIVEVEKPIEVDLVKEMDERLQYSLLKCFKYGSKKLNLPLLTSNFYKLHMIPATPNNQILDIKKSSFKKLSKFLAEMEKLGLITVKEQIKGVESITAIKFDHPLVINFVKMESDITNTTTETTKNDKNSTQILEMLSVTKPTLPLFTQFGLVSGQYVSKSDIRKYVTEYVRKENLQNSFNKSVVGLNDVLTTICSTSATHLTWEELIQKIESRLTPAFEMKTTAGIVQSKGKPKNIEMTVATRSGNKKVTLVDNLELFGISITEFGKKCSHGVAASTSISKPPGKKCDQLLVQGNQVNFIGKLLMEEYEIPKRYIRGLELGKKK